MRNRQETLFYSKLFVIMVMLLQSIRLLQLPFLYALFPYTVLILFFALLINDFSHRCSFWNNYGSDILIFTLFTYSISILLNKQYEFVNNIQMLFWLSFQYLIVYSFPQKTSCWKKTVFYIGIILIVFTTIVGFISLVMFIFDISGIANMANGIPFRYGFKNNRLFGLHGSPNYGALFSVFSIVYLMFFWQKSSWKRKSILCISFFLNYSYIILSKSRTGMLTLLWAFTLTFFIFSLKSISAKHLFGNIIKTLLLTLLLILGSRPIQDFYIFIRTQVAEFQVATPETPIEHLSTLPDEISLTRTDIKENIDNERFAIWADAIQYLVKDKPLFGHTNLAYIHYIDEFYPESFISERNKYSLHNDWITLLSGSGLIGFGLFLLFSCLCVRRVILYINKIKSNIAKLQEIAVPLSIVSTCALTTFFSDAIYLIFTAESLLFWLHLGILMHIIDQDSRKDQKIYLIINSFRTFLYEYKNKFVKSDLPKYLSK